MLAPRGKCIKEPCYFEFLLTNIKNVSQQTPEAMLVTVERIVGFGFKAFLAKMKTV